MNNVLVHSATSVVVGGREMAGDVCRDVELGVSSEEGRSERCEGDICDG